MNNSFLKDYYAYRIKLEKLKQKTWRLVVVARAILLLILVLVRYL